MAFPTRHGQDLPFCFDFLLFPAPSWPAPTMGADANDWLAPTRGHRPPPPPLSPGGLGQNRPFCCSPVSAAVRACLHPWSLRSDPQGFSPIPYICPHLFTTGRLQHTLLSLPEKLFSYTSPPFLFPLCLCLKICSKGDPVPGLSITLPWGMLQSRTAAERGCAAPQGHPPRAPDGSQGTPRTLP